MRKELLVLNLTKEAQIAGSGSEADVAGPHAVLACRAKLLDVRGSVQAMGSSKTANVYVQAGANYTAGTDVLSSSMAFTSTGLKKQGTIADKNIIYEAGQEFALSENSTSSSNVIGLSVQLYFQQLEALPEW